MTSDPFAPSTVKFDCPACAATLTVPAAAAGLQGPCPKCWQEIVSPDPALGTPARLPSLAPRPPKTLAPPEPAPPEPAPPEPAPPEPAPPEPTPPEPARIEIPPTAAPLPAARRRPSKLAFAAAILLSGLVFTGAGYLLGKSMRPEIPAALTLAPHAPPEPSPPDPTPAPVVETTPEPPPPLVLDEPGQLSARSALIAFLDAPDWKSRGTYVLLPEVVLPAMEAHAKENGDGPIKTTAIRLQETRNGDYFYQVSTPAIPEGFPVSVIATDEGPMIDWESFIGFHDDHFRKFIDGPYEQHAVLDLLVKPLAQQGHFFRYRLAAPLPGREADAFVRKDSVVFARLRGVLEGSSAFDKPTVERFLAASGVPMTLGLVKRETSDGKSFLEIEDFVAPGWGPPDP